MSQLWVTVNILRLENSEIHWKLVWQAIQLVTLVWQERTLVKQSSHQLYRKLHPCPRGHWAPGGRGEGRSDRRGGWNETLPGPRHHSTEQWHTTARPGCQCDPSEGSQRRRAPGPALFAGRIDYTSQAEMDHLRKAADNGMNHRESTLTARDKSRGANPRLGGGGKGRVGRESEQRGWH